MNSILTYRILLIEDDETAYLLTKSKLEQASLCTYEVSWINRYDEAHQRIAAKQLEYDAILVDYYLDKLNGLELLKEISKLSGVPPVIMLTGSNDSALDLEAMKLGASDFLCKEKLEPSLLDRSIRYSIERKRNEKLIIRQQREMAATLKLAALGEMVSTITHEINNPLVVIQGKVFAILRQLSALPPDLDKIKVCTKSIGDMVDRIIDIKDSLRTQDIGGAYRESEKVKLIDLLKEAFQLCEDKLNTHKIDVSIDCSDTLNLECLPIEISQVFINLISNASEAVSGLSERWIRVLVSEDVENLKIIFSDSGAGIDKSVQEQIFTKFYTTKKAGKGIGLNITRQIIESHGGKIKVDSENKNTAFIIQLPKQAGRMKKVVYRILIIDDESEILSILKDEITLYGHNAVVESNPLKARDKIQNETFDAVISDVHMPELDGLNLIQTKASTSNKPVTILISGNMSEKIKQRLQTEPGVHFFEKPFNVKHMVNQVINWISDAKTKEVQ